MKRRRCAHCGRFLGRYLIIAPTETGIALACPPCGPRVEGGAIKADAIRQIRRLTRTAFGTPSALAGLPL